MKVDMVIPTFRPDDTFCLLLQRLQEQTFLIHRLFLVNTDQALWDEAQKKYPIAEAICALPFPVHISQIRKEEFDHGGTRNFGAGLSDADIVIFMTQDAVAADRYLIERLTDALRFEQKNKKTVAVAYARQLPRENCKIVERYTRKFNYPDKSRIKGKEDLAGLGIKTYFCSDVCAAYRKDIFTKLGGFEEPVIFNEDMFYAAKAIDAGYYVAYAADARVVHSHNYSLKQQFSRNFDLAVSQKQHPEIFSHVSSEAEGIKLLKGAVFYLCSIRKPWLVFSLCAQCAAKYMGYFLGKHYERLSRKQILRCTASRDYWIKRWKQL